MTSAVVNDVVNDVTSPDPGSVPTDPGSELTETDLLNSEQSKLFYT